MKRGDTINPDSWFTADDFTLSGKTLVISKAKEAEIAPSTMKLVVFFEGESKGLVLNEVNRKIIEKNTGQTEPENWTGYHITPYSTEILMRGEVTPCIRIKQLIGSVAFKA